MLGVKRHLDLTGLWPAGGGAGRDRHVEQGAGDVPAEGDEDEEGDREPGVAEGPGEEGAPGKGLGYWSMRSGGIGMDVTEGRIENPEL